MVDTSDLKFMIKNVLIHLLIHLLTDLGLAAMSSALLCVIPSVLTQSQCDSLLHT